MSDISLEASSLEQGESTQIYCPYCDNQAPYSKSMSLTRIDTGALFYCFRPVCGAKGFIPIKGTPIRSRNVKRDSINPYKEYRYPLTPVVDSDSWFNQGVMVNEDRGTIAFPVYSIHGEQFGWVDRSFSGRVPKAINYLNPEFPKIHFPLRKGIYSEKSLVLVEDIPSSIAVNDYAQCAALLGTTLSKDVLELLIDHFKKIYIALDNDATAKAIRMKRELRTLFDVNVIMLPKDPKDMDEQELELFFGDCDEY